MASLLVAGVGVALLAADAGGQVAPSGRNGIVVVPVEGLIDAPTVSLIRDSIRDANEANRTLVILQIDSRGAIAELNPVDQAIVRSRVPVVTWVGPSGAEAKGAAAQLAMSAHALFISQNSTIGPLVPTRLDRGLPERVGVVGSPDPVLTRELTAAEARRQGIVDGVRPTVGETIVQLDGETIELLNVKLSTAKVVGKFIARRRQPNQEVVFRRLGLGASIQHALISPSMAYFLLVIGLALIVFEFFAASVGFAAAVGALAVVGAMYGFSHLPARWWAIAMIFLATFGFAVAAQAGKSRFWTVAAIVLLVGGSIDLYGGSSELDPPWWVLALVLAGAILFFMGAVPSFLRARFSSPTVGREGMIGEMGTAEVDVSPEGVVLVQGARWRARANRATPIAAGDPVRVVSVEGVVLEVEPESGGAQDYRDRARARRAKKGADS